MKLLYFVLPLFILSCNEDSTTVKKTSIPDSTVNKPDTTKKAAIAKLELTPLETEADQGQVTFSQNNKTVFYYSLKLKSGKVILNDKEYKLDKYANDNGTYKLSD